MRILHQSVFYPPIVYGGAERLAAALAEEQAKAGHQVGVVTLGKISEPSHDQNGVQVHRISHSNIFWSPDWPQYPAPARYTHKFLASWNPILRHRVGQIIESFRPDIIHSHSMVGFAVDSWKEAKQQGVPVIHTLHDFSLFCRNSNAFRDGHLCRKVCLACRVTELKRRYSRYLSGVVGVSRDILQRHLDLGFFPDIPPECRTVIHNMPPMTSQGRSPRPDAPFTIGFIGRILPEKGLDFLLKAVAGLPVGGWRLLIAGKVYPPLDLKTLQASVVGLPVEWLGFVRPEDFYSQIDLLVVPSIWAEPSPLVIYEAFVNGVAVVGAKIGGIQDLIEQDVTGWLYPAGDVDALRTILAERIKAGGHALPSEQAFANFKADTTANRVAERYQGVYGAAIAAFRSRSKEQQK